MPSDEPTTEAESNGEKGAVRTVREERTLSPMRRTIADRLSKSYAEAVHVTVTREADAEALVDARAAARERHDVDVSLTDVLLVALSETLADHPAFNATFEDGTHRIYEEYNVGVAVDVEDGLVTPVLAGVGGKSIEEIAVERARLSGDVRDGDYSMSDLRGGTFTVSNLGPLNADSFTPIINPPEVAILGVGRLRKRALPSDDGEVTFRRRITFDCSFDHRVVDGADAARFLDTLAGYVAEAESLLDGED